MEKKPLANLANVVVRGGNVDGPKKNVNLATTKNDPKLLKRGRDSPPNMMMAQKKKKNSATKIINNDENAVVFDPTRTIETKIKNIKISQKIDYLPLKKPVNNKQETTTISTTVTIKAVKNRNVNIKQKQQPSSPKKNDNKKCKNPYINWQDYYQPPKNLPDDVIDHDRTQLENINSEPIYAFKIFEYLREKEQSTRCQKYMQHQKEISPKMRTILVDWLVELQQTFELNHETLYHAIKIMDHFLMNKSIKRIRLQLLGIVSMFIAAKCDVCFNYIYVLVIYSSFFSITGTNLSNNRRFCIR